MQNKIWVQTLVLKAVFFNPHARLQSLTIRCILERGQVKMLSHTLSQKLMKLANKASFLISWKYFSSSCVSDAHWGQGYNVCAQHEVINLFSRRAFTKIRYLIERWFAYNFVDKHPNSGCLDAKEKIVVCVFSFFFVKQWSVELFGTAEDDCIWTLTMLLFLSSTSDMQTEGCLTQCRILHCKQWGRGHWGHNSVLGE